MAAVFEKIDALFSKNDATFEKPAAPLLQRAVWGEASISSTDDKHYKHNYTENQ